MRPQQELWDSAIQRAVVEAALVGKHYFIGANINSMPKATPISEKKNLVNYFLFKVFFQNDLFSRIFLRYFLNQKIKQNSQKKNTFLFLVFHEMIKLYQLLFLCKKEMTKTVPIKTMFDANWTMHRKGKISVSSKESESAL